jgi:hypothetical protein
LRAVSSIKATSRGLSQKDRVAARGAGGGISIAPSDFDCASTFAGDPAKRATLCIKAKSNPRDTLECRLKRAPHTLRLRCC